VAVDGGIHRRGGVKGRSDGRILLHSSRGSNTGASAADGSGVVASPATRRICVSVRSSSAAAVEPAVAIAGSSSGGGDEGQQAEFDREGHDEVDRRRPN
jgi:hypothetical protein